MSNLFIVQANNEYDLLICIFRILGVPSEDVWPGLESSIPGDAEHGYARTFLRSQRRANYQPRGLAKCVPNLDPIGLDLLQVRFFCRKANFFQEDARLQSSTEDNCQSSIESSVLSRLGLDENLLARRTSVHSSRQTYH